ncbi:MAG: ATPase [Cyclobacteriaceae bacterium]|nr:ATPase [Cyclobacteriaceae bacterium]
MDGQYPTNSITDCKDFKASHVVEFDACLTMLERAGRHYFGPDFVINPADYRVLFLLLVYFYHDLQSAEEYGIDLKKGILLCGPVGCGKTTVMFLMKMLLPEAEQYTMVSTRDVGLEYQREGYAVIEKYSTRSFFFRQGDIRPKTYCFDDLGLESPISVYGSDTNVMAEILLGRYPLAISQRMKTHATTNLSADEFEAIYGNRVRSRMRELFNLIAFDPDAPDKRS